MILSCLLDGCKYKIYNTPSCKFCIYTHPVNSKLTKWQSSTKLICLWSNSLPSQSKKSRQVAGIFSSFRKKKSVSLLRLLYYRKEHNHNEGSSESAIIDLEIVFWLDACMCEETVLRWLKTDSSIYFFSRRKMNLKE